MIARPAAPRPLLFAPSRQPSPRRVVAAGLAAGAAFLTTMWLDQPLLHEPTDDLVLLGGLLSARPLASRALGLLLHATNSVILAGLYAATLARWPGAPPWVKGVVFAVSENLLLWPIVLKLDTVHPWIVRHRLPTYGRPVPFGQEMLRHIVYGAVLGSLLAPPTAAPPTAPSPTAPLQEPA